MSVPEAHPLLQPGPYPGAELSVVIPTYNEADNVSELFRRLTETLGTIRWEAIFVDDSSPDGTADTVRALSSRDGRARVLQRLGRRGLSSACIEGMLASSAPYVAVMDADLQHDERLLPRMLETLRRGGADVVIGSRYVAGGGGVDGSRHALSLWATRLSRVVLAEPVADPMSGFFMMRRPVLAARVADLSGIGFKILLDMLTARGEPLRVVELPYQFRARLAGDSKLDSAVAWDFLLLVGERLFGRFVPVRFVAFAAVGAAGLLVHLAVLTFLLKGAGASFPVSQSGATFAAMTFNFAINNVLTFREWRLRGLRWWWGWLTFCLACGAGALANIGIASWLFSHRTQWILAAVAGVAVGAVWNYAVTSAYTWRRTTL